MNRDLEALIKAFDAYVEAKDKSESLHFWNLYSSRLEDVVAGTSTKADALDRLIRIRHNKWKQANQKPPTLPPRA